MHVDDELKWNHHIQQLCEKVGRMINYLARIKHFLNTSALKIIYNTVILPHFDYADIVWQSATKTQLEFLQKLQNRAARIILNVNPYEHKSTLELHHILNWEYLGRRRLKHTMSFMYKILHNMAPEYMEEEFEIKSSKYGLRKIDVLVIAKPRTNYGKRTFSYHGAKLYNEIPISARQAISLTDFNKQVSELSGTLFNVI